MFLVLKFEVSIDLILNNSYVDSKSSGCSFYIIDLCILHMGNPFTFFIDLFI